MGYESMDARPEFFSRGGGGWNYEGEMFSGSGGAGRGGGRLFGGLLC